MTVSRYSRPVVPLLIALMSGILMGTRFTGYGFPVIIVAVICIGFSFYLIRRKRFPAITPLCLFSLLGYMSIQPWVSPDFPPNHVIHFADTHAWQIKGTIVDFPQEISNRMRFDLDAWSLSDPAGKTSFPVVGRIRVTVYPDAEKQAALSAGDVISFRGRIKALRNFHNPGGFDYERYMAFEKIRASASTQSDRLIVLSSEGRKSFPIHIERVRAQIAAFIDSVPEKNGSKQDKALLKALIIGDRSGITPEMRQDFNRCGIGHLLAISGLHVGIVAGAVFFVLRWVLSFVDTLLWRAWVRKWAAVLSIFPVLAYGLIAGMSPSTQRAVIMVLVFLLTFVFEREHDLINTIGLAAMVILAFHPPSLLSVSFQLSFVAVFCIVYGLSKIPSPWIMADPVTRMSWMMGRWKKLAGFMLVSLFATLGTLPLVMTYFNQVSIIGILANCIMVPLIGFLAVPMGLFSVALHPLWHFGAGLLINISTWIIHIAISITRCLSDLPFAAAKTITPSLLEIIGYYLLVWAILNYRFLGKTLQDIRQHTHQDLSVTPINHEKLGMLANRWTSHLPVIPFNRFLVIMLLAFFVSDGIYWINKRFWNNDLKITILDVGQGSAALLELPGGTCYMIDGGGFADNAVFDVGERIIAPLLWQKKIMTVDTLVLTHANSDHLNGLLYIADHFNVKNLWMNNDIADTRGYYRLIEIAEDKKIHRPDFRTIPRWQNINGVAFQILNPLEMNTHERRPTPRKDLDDNSLVIKVTYGKHTYLFTGDIKDRAEKNLVAYRGNRLKSDILIAPHHGSKTSSSMPFLKKVAPDIIIVPAGWKNRYGFPNLSVVERYDRIGSQVYVTGDHGAVTMVTDGENLDVDTQVEIQ